MKHVLMITTVLLLATPVWAGEGYKQPTGQTQGQGQGQAQQMRQGQRQGQSQGLANRNDININQQAGGGSGGGYNARGNTPDVLIPSIATGNVCALPVTAGAAFSGIGFGFGAAAESKNCEIRQLAGLFVSMNMRGAAKETLCQSDVARRALYSYGTPCARDAKGWDR